MAYNLGIHAALVVDGELADDRISVSSVEQHEALLEINDMGISGLLDLGEFLAQSSTMPTEDSHLSRKAYVDSEVSSVSADLASEAATARAAEEANAEAIGSVADALSVESAQRQASDSTLQGLIEAEAATARAAEDQLTADLASEAATARAAEQANAAAIELLQQDHTNDAQNLADYIASTDDTLAGMQSDHADDAAALAAYITSNDTAVGTERARIDAILESAGADSDSFAEIVSLINSVDTENDEAFAAYVLSNDQALADAIAAFQAADTAMAADYADLVAAEAAQRVAQDGVLTQALVDAQAALQAADATNAQAISDESAARASAVEGLQGDIGAVADDLAAEAVSRGNQDAVLQGLIEAEATTARAAEQANATAISNEANNRAAAVEALQEADAGQAADIATNAAAIEAEATAARAAEAALGVRIDNILDAGESLDQVSEMLAAWTTADNSVLAQVQSVLDTHNADVESLQGDIADNAAAIIASDTASATFRARTDNPHSVTASQVGLGDVAQGDYSGQGMKVAYRAVAGGEAHAVADGDYMIFCGAGSEITLPAPSGMQGRKIVIKVGELGGGSVALVGQIDGADGMAMIFDYSSVTLVCDGASQWYIV